MDDDAVAIQNAFNVEFTHMRRSLAGRLFDRSEIIFDTTPFSNSLKSETSILRMGNAIIL